MDQQHLKMPAPPGKDKHFKTTDKIRAKPQEKTNENVLYSMRIKAEIRDEIGDRKRPRRLTMNELMLEFLEAHEVMQDKFEQGHYLHEQDRQDGRRKLVCFKASQAVITVLDEIGFKLDLTQGELFESMVGYYIRKLQEEGVTLSFNAEQK